MILTDGRAAGLRNRPALDRRSWLPYPGSSGREPRWRVMLHSGGVPAPVNAQVPLAFKAASVALQATVFAASAFDHYLVSCLLCTEKVCVRRWMLQARPDEVRPPHAVMMGWQLALAPGRLRRTATPQRGTGPAPPGRAGRRPGRGRSACRAGGPPPLPRPLRARVLGGRSVPGLDLSTRPGLGWSAS
jgi:hypothetical protein